MWNWLSLNKCIFYDNDGKAILKKFGREQWILTKILTW